MGATWLVGVAINLVGSIFINLGTNVMKLGHNKLAAMPRTPIGAKNTVSKIREWQIGVALFSLGNVGNFVSFGELAWLPMFSLQQPWTCPALILHHQQLWLHLSIVQGRPDSVHNSSPALLPTLVADLSVVCCHLCRICCTVPPGCHWLRTVCV
eukprot:GHRR01024211.1.p1 GENE.GHRR01024211.1~~GHRR01024211.1.p1  ORF type:complete len:154 (+),score=27.59 GHRR01024211.1:505-966(+)